MKEVHKLIYYEMKLPTIIENAQLSLLNVTKVTSARLNSALFNSIGTFISHYDKLMNHSE